MNANVVEPGVQSPGSAAPPFEEGSSGGQRAFTWAGLLLLGWLVFEWTSQPALAALLVCLKFGWGDWRAARWLRKYDPDPDRGQACFWVYVGWALWKVTAAALAVSLLFFFVIATWLDLMGAAGPGNVLKRLLPILIGTFLLVLVGMLASLLATVRAFWLAHRHRLKLWVGREARLARKERLWPPRGPGSNQLGWLVNTHAIVFLFWPIPFLALLRWDGPTSPVPIVVFIASLAMLGVTGRWVVEPAWADTPGSCWPEETLEQAAARPGAQSVASSPSDAIM
jgi:hypothetical protein